jgi:S-DNA-T family DNA segregation ATPase FtsK/SpoIIIE
VFVLFDFKVIQRSRKCVYSDARNGVARKKQNKNKKKPVEFGPGAMAAMYCFGIIFGLVLFFSCLSFDIADYPSPYAYPLNTPTSNWCGSVGAFFAYYLLYSIGPGVFVIIISTILYLAAKLMRRDIDQLIFRAIGLALLTVAISSSFQCLWPARLFAFPFGSGGALGIATADLLKENFAQVGTFILILAIWIVGLILLADDLVLALPLIGGKFLMRLLGIATPAWAVAMDQSDRLGQIWQRLSAKQKSKRRSLRPAYLQDPDMDEVLESELDLDEDEYEDEAYEDADGDEEEHEDEAGIAQDAVSGKSEDKPAEKQSTFERLRALAINRNGIQPRATKPYVQPSYDDYTLPPLTLLAEPEYGYAEEQEQVVKDKAAVLQRFLSEFNVNAQVIAAETGPVVTMYEVELAAGVKVSQISGLSNDMARALSVGAVRVVAPLPGKHTIGLEVPNSKKETVRIRSLFEDSGQKHGKMAIPLFLGKDSSGESLVSDLAKMPHLLIAGTTGSGKSVCINSIIVSILMTKRPDEVKLILVDPKMVEMTAYNTVPHLMCPIVTETPMAVQILEWATVKMDERYAVLAEGRVKNIAEFNKLGAKEVIRRFNPTTPDEEAKIPKQLPYIVIIIDELADLMMTASKEIESYIVRLAQKSRAVGIHIVLATQRPQATVVTGLIKSNMPTRIGFRVAARMDSRIILDQNGAEMLLGEGDMLFLKPGTSDLIRAQGTFLDDNEIRHIVRHLKEVGEPQFHPELTQLKHIDTSEMQKDDLFDEAVRVVLASKRGSVSLLQRRLSIGYARSSRIIEMMASSGILGEYKGSQAREVLMTLEEYEAICAQMETDAANGYSDMAESQPEDSKYVSEGQREYMAIDSEDADVTDTLDDEEEIDDDEENESDEDYEYVEEEEEDEDEDVEEDDGEEEQEEEDAHDDERKTRKKKTKKEEEEYEYEYKFE